MSLCLFPCQRTCLSVRKEYKNSEVRGNAHATISWSLSVMNTTWLNTAEECFAQTRSGDRLSPRMCEARTLYIYNQSLRVMSVGGRQKRSSTAWAVEGLRLRCRWGCPACQLFLAVTTCLQEHQNMSSVHTMWCEQKMSKKWDIVHRKVTCSHHVV